MKLPPDTPAQGEQTQGLQIVRTAAYRAVSGAWNAPAILACSGGTDSSALVVLAAEARRRRKLGPCVVAHVDHRSRPDSAQDATAVRNLCARFGLPFCSLVVDDDRPIPGRSDEDVWRERRYRALEAAARRLGIETIVTAHTRDDQVETVLMRMLTGAVQLTMPGDAIRGQPGQSTRLLRPLLDISRAELDEVLAIAGVEPLEDPSNTDRRFRRNALRHDVIPLLERTFPHFDRALLRSAALHALDSEHCWNAAEEEYLLNADLDTPGEVALPRGRLRELHPAIGTRVVRLAARALIRDTDDRELTYERVVAVLAATGGRSGAVIELPYGVRVDVERERIRFRMEEG